MRRVLGTLDPVEVLEDTLGVVDSGRDTVVGGIGAAASDDSPELM